MKAWCFFPLAVLSVHCSRDGLWNAFEALEAGLHTMQETHALSDFRNWARSLRCALSGAIKDTERSLVFWKDVEVGRDATTWEIARERKGLKNLADIVAELYRYYRSFAESDLGKKLPSEETSEYVCKLENTVRSFRACACSLKTGESRWKRISQHSKLHDVKKMLGECERPNFDEFADAIAYVGRIIEKHGNDLSMLLYLNMCMMKLPTLCEPDCIHVQGA